MGVGWLYISIVVDCALAPNEYSSAEVGVMTWLRHLSRSTSLFSSLLGTTRRVQLLEDLAGAYNMHGSKYCAEEIQQIVACSGPGPGARGPVVIIGGQLGDTLGGANFASAQLSREPILYSRWLTTRRHRSSSGRAPTSCVCV